MKSLLVGSIYFANDWIGLGTKYYFPKSGYIHSFLYIIGLRTDKHRHGHNEATLVTSRRD